MPYERLPARLRQLIPSERGQEIFRNTVNSQLDAGRSESVAFASAWSALRRAGFVRDNATGKWERTEKASGAKPLYMKRKVLNAEKIVEWAKSQGIPTTLDPDDMHVTVIYSKDPFSEEYTRHAEMQGEAPMYYGNHVVRGGKRSVERLGQNGEALVLKIECPRLAADHYSFRAMGASSDWPDYKPHITLSWQAEGVDEADIEPFDGDIVLSDIFVSLLDEDWKSKVTEKSRKETLEDKVREHNAEHGDKGRVTLSMLEQVYDRGVGAYRTNPSSVRPNVKSPEQWAMARVNVFLQAIRTGKFPSGKFDTDLLPKEHPLSTRKSQPSASAVHVSSTDWERTRKEDTFRPPASARNNARRVLRWKEKYGDEVKGMTQVGWTRANQLASGENLSRDTVARMSAFARHRKNAEVDPKFKDTPWKDRGYVAYLGWGGETGISWANSVMERLKKRVDLGPFPFESRVSSNRVEDPSDIFSAADDDLGPCLAVFSLKSDVSSVSKGAELLGTPFFCSDAGGDAESLLVMPLSKISVSVEPSSDIVWNEFNWNFGSDEIVCLSRDDTPSSEIIKQSLAANSDNSMRQFVLSAGFPDDCRFLKSNIFSKIAHMLNVSGSDAESVSASYLTDTSVSENKTRPVSSLLGAALEKIFVPLDSIGRANARTPRAMLSHNTLIFHDAGDSAGSDFKKSRNGDTPHTFKVEVGDFLLLSFSDAGHVTYDTLGGVVGQLSKRQIDDDSFTDPASAVVRSMDLGLGGEIHVHDRDGQAVYMPGEDHKDYLERIREIAGIESEEDDDESPVKEGLLERTISAIIGAIMQQVPVDKSQVNAQVLKMDDEQRLVWGWAYVSTEDGKLLVDTQGDSIEPAEMEKMATDFMANSRNAKIMHKGEVVGQFIHSIPLTNDLMKAFDIYSDREGWIVAMRPETEELWKAYKRGDYTGFSIGGKAGDVEEYDAA